MKARIYNTGIKIQNEDKNYIKTAKINPCPNTHASQVKPKIEVLKTDVFSTDELNAVL